MSEGATYPIEPKVKFATIASYILGAILVAAFTAADNGQLIEALPDWATSLLAPLMPAIGAFLAGYAARHQYRATEGRTAPTP